MSSYLIQAQAPPFVHYPYHPSPHHSSHHQTQMHLRTSAEHCVATPTAVPHPYYYQSQHPYNEESSNYTFPDNEMFLASPTSDCRSLNDSSINEKSTRNSTLLELSFYNHSEVGPQSFNVSSNNAINKSTFPYFACDSTNIDANDASRDAPSARADCIIIGRSNESDGNDGNNALRSLTLDGPKSSSTSQQSCASVQVQGSVGSASAASTPKTSSPIGSGMLNSAATEISASGSTADYAKTSQKSPVTPTLLQKSEITHPLISDSIHCPSTADTLTISDASQKHTTPSMLYLRDNTSEEHLSERNTESSWYSISSSQPWTSRQPSLMSSYYSSTYPDVGSIRESPKSNFFGSGFDVLDSFFPTSVPPYVTTEGNEIAPFVESNTLVPKAFCSQDTLQQSPYTSGCKNNRIHATAELGSDQSQNGSTLYPLYRERLITPPGASQSRVTAACRIENSSVSDCYQHVDGPSNYLSANFSVSSAYITGRKADTCSSSSSPKTSKAVNRCSSLETNQNVNSSGEMPCYGDMGVNREVTKDESTKNTEWGNSSEKQHTSFSSDSSLVNCGSDEQAGTLQQFSMCLPDERETDKVPTRYSGVVLPFRQPCPPKNNTTRVEELNVPRHLTDSQKQHTRATQFTSKLTLSHTTPENCDSTSVNNSWGSSTVHSHMSSVSSHSLQADTRHNAFNASQGASLAINATRTSASLSSMRSANVKQDSADETGTSVWKPDSLLEAPADLNSNNATYNFAERSLSSVGADGLVVSLCKAQKHFPRHCQQDRNVANNFPSTLLYSASTSTGITQSNVDGHAAYNNCQAEGKEVLGLAPVHNTCFGERERVDRKENKLVLERLASKHPEAVTDAPSHVYSLDLPVMLSSSSNSFSYCAQEELTSGSAASGRTRHLNTERQPGQSPLSNFVSIPSQFMTSDLEVYAESNNTNRNTNSCSRGTEESKRDGFRGGDSDSSRTRCSFQRSRRSRVTSNRTSGDASVLGALLQRLFCLYQPEGEIATKEPVRNQRKTDTITSALKCVWPLTLLELLKDLISLQSLQSKTATELAAEENGNFRDNAASMTGNGESQMIFSTLDVEAMTDKLFQISGIPNREFLRLVASWLRRNLTASKPSSKKEELPDLSNAAIMLPASSDALQEEVNLNSSHSVSESLQHLLHSPQSNEMDFYAKRKIATNVVENWPVCSSSYKSFDGDQSCLDAMNTERPDGPERLLPALGLVIENLTEKVQLLQQAFTAQVDLQAKTLTALAKTQSAMAQEHSSYVTFPYRDEAHFPLTSSCRDCSCVTFDRRKRFRTSFETGTFCSSSGATAAASENAKENQSLKTQCESRPSCNSGNGGDCAGSMDKMFTSFCASCKHGKSDDGRGLSSTIHNTHSQCSQAGNTTTAAMEYACVTDTVSQQRPLEMQEEALLLSNEPAIPSGKIGLDINENCNSLEPDKTAVYFHKGKNILHTEVFSSCSRDALQEIGDCSTLNPEDLVRRGDDEPCKRAEATDHKTTSNSSINVQNMNQGVECSGYEESENKFFVLSSSINNQDKDDYHLNNTPGVCLYGSLKDITTSSSFKNDTASCIRCLLQLQALASASPLWAKHYNSHAWHRRRLENKERVFSSNSADFSLSPSQNNFSLSNPSSMAAARTEEYLNVFYGNLSHDENATSLEKSCNSEGPLKLSDLTEKIISPISQEVISFVSRNSCTNTSHTTDNGCLSVSGSAGTLPACSTSSESSRCTSSPQQTLSLRVRQAVELIPLWLSRLDHLRVTYDPTFRPLFVLPCLLQSNAFAQCFSNLTLSVLKQLESLRAQFTAPWNRYYAKRHVRSNGTEKFKQELFAPSVSNQQVISPRKENCNGSTSPGYSEASVTPNKADASGDSPLSNETLTVMAGTSYADTAQFFRHVKRCRSGVEQHASSDKVAYSSVEDDPLGKRSNCPKERAQHFAASERVADSSSSDESTRCGPPRSLAPSPTFSAKSLAVSGSVTESDNEQDLKKTNVTSKDPAASANTLSSLSVNNQSTNFNVFATTSRVNETSEQKLGSPVSYGTKENKMRSSSGRKMMMMVCTARPSVTVVPGVGPYSFSREPREDEFRTNMPAMGCSSSRSLNQKSLFPSSSLYNPSSSSDQHQKVFPGNCEERGSEPTSFPKDCSVSHDKTNTSSKTPASELQPTLSGNSPHRPDPSLVPAAMMPPLNYDLNVYNSTFLPEPSSQVLLNSLSTLPLMFTEPNNGARGHRSSILQDTLPSAALPSHLSTAEDMSYCPYLLHGPVSFGRETVIGSPPGVFWSAHDNAWIAYLHDLPGIDIAFPVFRRFLVSEYGFDGARHLALQYRHEAERHFFQTSASSQPNAHDLMGGKLGITTVVNPPTAMTSLTPGTVSIGEQLLARGSGFHPTIAALPYAQRNDTMEPPQITFPTTPRELVVERPNTNSTGLIKTSKDTLPGGVSTQASTPPKSEVPGVYWYRNRNGWVAQWFENGKNKHKFFAASAYGIEGAKQKAIAYRIMKVEEKRLKGW